MKIPFFKQISCYLILSMLLFSIVPGVEASMVGSEFLGPSLSDRQMNIQKLQRFLESEIVSKRLLSLGFAADEVTEKLDALTDEELHEFAMRADKVRVAGDGGLGVVVALLVIAILVVLFLQLTGHRVIVVDD